MKNLEILNNKDKKKILQMLKEQFGFDKDLDYAFLKDPKDKIYLVNKDIKDIDFKKLRLNSLGMYFGKIKDQEIRLSVEGSQLIGKDSSKNILELDKDQLISWMSGEDIKLESELKGFVLIKHKSDFICTGRIKENTLLNFLPKSRRMKVTDQL